MTITWRRKGSEEKLYLDGVEQGSIWQDKDGRWHWRILDGPTSRLASMDTRTARRELLHQLEARRDVQMAANEILAELRLMRQAADQYHEALARRPEVVRQARAFGLTWAQIGEALGISMQAAAKSLVEKSARIDPD